MAMELDHSFTVPVPPDQAWDVLLDVKRVAPCMPGATVDSVEGDDVAGRLKVKVGPVSLTYKGTAKFTDRDPDTRSILVEASGKETRGSGTASATVKAALSPYESAESNGDGAGSDDQTLVTIHTTLNVTGRPAQFGRGVIAEVGSRLIDKFADNLAQQLASGSPEPASAASASPASPASPAAAASPSTPETAAAPAAAPRAAASYAPGETPAPTSPAAPVQPATRPVPAQEPDDHLDLLSIVGPVIAKRLVPVVGAAAGVVLLTWGARRIFRRRKSA
jgi:carbon monoxide dehydrogenase subunit G